MARIVYSVPYYVVGSFPKHHMLLQKENFTAESPLHREHPFHMAEAAGPHMNKKMSKQKSFLRSRLTFTECTRPWTITVNYHVERLWKRLFVKRMRGVIMPARHALCCRRKTDCVVCKLFLIAHYTLRGCYLTLNDTRCANCMTDWNKNVAFEVVPASACSVTPVANLI